MTISSIQQLRLLSFCVSLLVLSGCGSGNGAESRPRVFPVKGTVTFKGKPLANATITFIPDGPGESATGVTDSDGSYFLSTYHRKDGAVIGGHVVTVSVGPSSDVPYVPGFDQFYKTSLIPKSYLDAKSTPLNVEVKDQAVNKINLDIEDK